MSRKSSSPAQRQQFVEAIVTDRFHQRNTAQRIDLALITRLVDDDNLGHVRLNSLIPQQPGQSPHDDAGLAVISSGC
jgi:hypothetical protein